MGVALPAQTFEAPYNESWRGFSHWRAEMLKFNEETKVVFANDDAAVAPVREITEAEVAGLVANGATVDASANLGKSDSSAGATEGAAPAALVPDAPATGSVMAGEPGNAPSTSGIGILGGSTTSATLTPDQKAAQDVVDAGTAPAGNPASGEFTSADGTTAPTDEVHPAHEATNALERFMERISNDFLKEGKALVAAVRAEVDKLVHGVEND
jgi:hypothetical protein